MSKSPNNLNLNSYTQGEGIQAEYSEQPTDRELESQTIEEQFDNFVKDIQNYNEIVNQLAKNVDRANAQEYFITDFYPEFALNNTYQDDEQKKIVATTDPQLAKIMQNLQRNNRILKEQLKGWLFEFSKKTRLSEILITQNEILRKRLCSKNKEIVKLIETINRTQNSDLVELNETLSQLKEENGVLLEHLSKIKQSIKSNKIEEKKLIEAYEKNQSEKLLIQQKISQVEDDEQHYSKQINLLQNSINQMQKRQKKLQTEKERLSKILDEYTVDERNIEKQLENCNIDRQEIENQLKRKFEGHHSKKQKILEEIDEISDQMKRAKEESKELQTEITRNHNKIEQFKKLSADLDKKIQEGEEKIKQSDQELKDVINAEAQYLSDMDIIDFEIDILETELKQLEDKQQEESENLKRELKEIEDSKKRQLQKWTEEYQKVQRQSCTRVLQEKSELAFKKKEIEDWERKIADKNSELMDLKLQLKEIKENQGKAIELRKKLRDAKLQ